jgi:photosystem II stability/assembly factor-like uncharacterized protein
VYAGTRGGILASTDGGARWRRLRPRDSADLHYTALAIDPTAPETLYAGTDREGIVKSTDGGRRFEARNTGVFGVDVTTLLVGAAAGSLRMGSGDGGLHETVDGGGTWTRVEDVDERVRCLVRDPAGNLYAGTDGSIFKIAKGGTSWLPVRRGLPDDVRVGALAFDPKRPDTLYALTRSHGMFRTVDAGAHWTAAEAPSPWGAGSRDAYPLVLDPTTPETVLTSADYGLWKTGDGGRSWTAAAKTGLPAAEMIALVADPIAKTLYAGFSQAGVYKSTDGGTTWTASPKGIGRASVQALLVDPLTAGTVYAGTHASGVFKTTDAGATWTRIPGSDRLYPDITSLALESGGPILYVGTGGGSVYRFDPGLIKPAR